MDPFQLVSNARRFFIERCRAPPGARRARGAVGHHPPPAPALRATGLVQGRAKVPFTRYNPLLTA
jgi:hypothetical protein